MGKVKRFRDFYTNNRERFFGYLLKRTGDRNLAADTMQESFTKYLEQYGKRDLNISLLFTIGRNLINDHARGKRPLVPYEERIQPGQHDEESAFLVREKTNQVREAIKQLNPREAEILSLAVTQNVSYREIAERTGTSEANVKVHIHRARMKIKKQVSEES